MKKLLKNYLLRIKMYMAWIKNRKKRDQEDAYIYED